MSSIIVVFPKKEIATNIRNILVRNGFDVIGVGVTGAQAGQLADILDVTPTTMSFKLSGRSSLSLRECVEIKRKAFPDKTLDYLFATDESSE